MNSFGFELYKIAYEKDAVWMDKIVTGVRRDWQPIFPIAQAIKNRKILLCEQSLEKIKKK